MLGVTMKPELLAPAGDWEAMRAAVANGADAVYFGLSNFNARHRATNFTLEELPGVMAYLHGRNVRGYVTLNTLIFTDELDDASRFIAACADAGVDALIVQDLGVTRLIKTIAPTLAVHGSTQMTLTEPRGIAFVRALGVERVILAREMSITDIDAIAPVASLPVEVFVHGALCISYSGQCLTSESIGGRSANRGQCAQACRLPYDLVVDGARRDLGDKAYLLSPQDLAGHAQVADLLARGVVSYKIEGRLKSAHYVAATTRAYRAALDAAVAGQPFTLPEEARNDLQQSFSRGFTPGFLEGINHQSLVPARFPKSRGVQVGKVAARTERGLVVDVSGVGSRAKHPQPAPLQPGDGVVFDEGHPEQDEQGGRVFEVRPRGRDAFEITLGDGDVNLAAVALGALVWKTDDPRMRRRLERSFSRDVVAHREPLAARAETAVGAPMRLTLTDATGRSAMAESTEALQLAVKRPLTVALLREQLGRLGDTPFELGAVALLDGGVACETSPVMAPMSMLNDLRRRVVEMLLAQRDTATRHTIADRDALAHLRGEIVTARAEPLEPRLYVLARSLEQLAAVLDWSPPADRAFLRPSMVYVDFEDVKRYREAVALARAASVPIAIATTRIIKPHEEGLLRHIADCGADGILARNLAALTFFRDTHAGILFADYSMNVANELTAQVMREAGVARMVPSYDLNWQQMAAMFARFPVNTFEAVVHQHMPMFHMEHCVFAATLSNGKDHRDCGRPCERHKVDLRDRVGAAHPLIADVGCRNTVYNGVAQSAAEYVPRMLGLGLRHFRVELLRDDREQTHAVLDRYAAVLAGREDPRRARRSLRVLNQLGVTRGTLEFD